MLRAVRLAAAGDAMLTPSVTRQVIHRFTTEDRTQRRREALSRLDRLTERERDVIVQIGLGHSNAEIARNLQMSEATVKTSVPPVVATRSSAASTTSMRLPRGAEAVIGASRCQRLRRSAWQRESVHPRVRAPGRTRTYDLGIRSPLLYPLSYERPYDLMVPHRRTGYRHPGPNNGRGRVFWPADPG